MINNIDNETDTAVTVVADDNIKELLKSGNIEEIQRVVQDGETVITGNASCLSWSKGQIVGKYEIIKKIGKGGMGVIYLARHTQLDTLRALKLLPAESVEENPVFAERFIREARIASKIRHPNVVEVMDVEKDTQLNVSYIVMEYVDGGSLRQVLKGQSKLSIEQAIVTIQGVASALCVAAEHGIVHRDIKPDNIMFTKRGGVKLADLGIAKQDDEDDNLTKTNVMMGTPAYLSPEQVENPKAVDIRSDIYSLGATFYEMMTGQVPYPGKTSYDILRKIFSEPVPNPQSINPEIPGEIASIVMKMLAKEPEKRYQTPAQLLETLAEIIPAISETDIQLIIQSIIQLKSGGGNSEYTSYNSLFTGTMCRMRRKEKIKKILIRSGIVLAALAVCVSAWLVIKNLSISTSMLVKKNTAEISNVPGVKNDRPEPVVHTLNIVTTPLATLRLTAETGQILTYAGNSEGIFKIPGLSAGAYEVEISCPDHFTYKQKHTVPTEGSLNLPLKQDLKVLVLNGMPGTKLELEYSDGQKRHFTIPETGSVRISNLKKGDYLVKATLKNYFSVEKRFVLEGDLAVPLQMEKIFKQFTLTTLPGSEVKLRQNTQVKYSKKTNAMGKCRFEKIRKGVYELNITAPHYKAHNSILNMEDDIAVTISLVKQLYSLTVYGAEGVQGEIYLNGQHLHRFKIPASGFLVLGGIGNGKYSLNFSRNGYISRKYDINVVENTSLQVNLAAVPRKVAPPVKRVKGHIQAALKAKHALKKKSKAKPAVGKLNIFFSSSPEMMDYIQKNGMEIKIGSGKWERVKSIPFIRSLGAGRYNIGVRGKGILTRSDQEIMMPAGKNSDIWLEIIPRQSEVSFESNRPDTEVKVNGRICNLASTIYIDPFKEYVVTASYDNRTQTRKILSSSPGEKMNISFSFVKAVHPQQKQYESGMKLFDKGEFKESLPLLLEAAKEKHLEATLKVAEIYEKGLGMWFSDSDEAVRWYWQAAELGNVSAAVKIGDAIYEGKIEGTAMQMLKFYQLAVQASYPEITYKLAVLYRKGYKEIVADDTKALHYLKLAAELAVPAAMYDLGIRYEKGEGVPRDSRRALFWVKKAANRNHEQARRYLEQMK